MKKPTPEEFGLTDNDVERLRDIEHRLCISDRVYLVTLLIGLAACWVWFLVRSSIIALGVAYGIWPLTLTWLCENAPGVIIKLRYSNFDEYRRFSKAREKYDSWFQRTQRAFWQTMGGHTLEFEVGRLLDKRGSKARVTPGTNDKGVDIFLDDGSVVQCKAHKKPVSPAVVRELYGAMAHFHAPRGILVALNGFTQGAIEFAVGKPIELWDVDDLVEMQGKTAA